MWHTSASDDADRAGYCGCDPFLPGDGYDPMYDSFEREPKCGGPDRCPGCRRCYAPDRELKPHGFGFDRYEHSPAYRLGRELAANAAVTLGCVVGGPVWYGRYLAWTGFNARLERVSDRVWDKLCDECETHPEAVRRYEAWAEKVAAKLA